MTLRRTLPLFLALLACQTELDRRPLRPVEYAVFDPASSLIPLPNDLALASAASLPDGAQKELLLAFATAQGFPNDQEVPLTIDFTRAVVDPSTGAISYEAPDLDLSTLTEETVLVLKLTGGAAPTPVGMDLAHASYLKGETRGTLTLRRSPNASGKRNWDGAAQYVAAIRGGRNGVRVTGGHPDGLQPQPTFYVLRESARANKRLTDPENQGLLPGTDAEQAAAAAQLEPIRQLYQGPLALIDEVAPFGSDEVAVMATFAVEGGTSVPVDAATGTAPLPFDLLRNPVTGKIVNNPAFGPAAAGLATLDGFSTTAMILAPTTGPVDAATVNAASVSLYKLNGAGAPTKLTDLAAALGGGTPAAAAYVTEPGAITAACPSASGRCSTTIGLAPAVPAPVPNVGTFYLPPLDENAEYAVVVRNGVKDMSGAALHRSTYGKILLSVQQPLLVAGKSVVAGVADDVAGQIMLQKAKLAPVLAVEDASKVVMAWTFKTQSITGTSVRLSAAVYDPAVAPAIAAAAPTADPVLAAAHGAGMFPGVAAFLSTTIPTLDAIDPANGALKDPATNPWTATAVPALVAVPDATQTLPACAGSAPKVCPLVVFHHGLGGGRYQMAALASRLAAAGFVVAAIDAPYHGHRAFCAEDAECGTGGVCTPDPAKAGQGDAVPPGTCTAGALQLDPARMTTTASGNYFISANFFRTRDGIRQDLVDQGAVSLALAPPPGTPASPFTTALATTYGVAVHPGKVYYVGQSLGGIIGTNVVATNARFSRAVLNVAGGTMVDVFTNSPAFAADVDALFLSLGIDRHDPAEAAAYLKTLSVAKWILDPADPVNFAAHLRTAPLPNLLVDPTGATAQAAKDVLGQAALGDGVVPNAFNALLYSTADIPWSMYVDADAPGNVVSHGFLSSSADAQNDVIDWLQTLTFPGAQVTLP